MTWNDRDAESFFARASKDSPPDETPCRRCGIEICRHIGGRCGRYAWPRSNERRRGQAEPDDPRRTYPVAASKTAAATTGDGPADLSRLGIPALLDELRAVCEPDRPAVRRSEPESMALAARQAAESRAWFSTGCG